MRLVGGEEKEAKMEGVEHWAGAFCHVTERVVAGRNLPCLRH